MTRAHEHLRTSASDRPVTPKRDAASPLQSESDFENGFGISSEDSAVLSFEPLPILQALPTAPARVCLDVRRFLERELRLQLHERHLLLAVSGGADSLALLAILLLLRSRWNCTLAVFHLDHRLRPESSKEAQMVVRLCASWNIPCTARAVDVAAYAGKQGLGLEDAGRKLRYTLLEKERRRIGADWILTGHHRADLEEDVLLRLIRGTGWPALGGMTALDRRRRLLRPLLCSAPDDLRALLQACNLPWAEDSSNADLRYKRNRVRHDILPLLREENPSLHRSIRTLWRLAREDATHWEMLLDNALAQTPMEEDAAGGIILPRALLLALDSSGRLRLYLRVLRTLRENVGHGQARAETLFALDAAWNEGRGGARFQLPGDITAALQRGSIHFMLPQ